MNSSILKEDKKIRITGKSVIDSVWWRSIPVFEMFTEKRYAWSDYEENSAKYVEWFEFIVLLMEKIWKFVIKLELPCKIQRIQIISALTFKPKYYFNCLFFMQF